MGYKVNAKTRSFLLLHLFKLSSNLFDKTGDEISSRATFAGWSHTNSIITDKQRALALRRYRKGDPHDTTCVLRISVLQGIRDELVDNQTEGNGSVVG